MSSFQTLLVKFSALLCADTKETSLGGIIKMLKRYSLFRSAHWVLPELRRTQKHPFPNDTVILFLASYWLSKMKPLTSNLFIQSSLELICLERKKRQINKKHIFEDKEFSMQHYFKQSRLHMTEILGSYDWHFLNMSEMHSVRAYAQ